MRKERSSLSTAIIINSEATDTKKKKKKTEIKTSVAIYTIYHFLL